MAKLDEEKSDGLEIISIGALYIGPWDKKYWSSSRGKDRYPYPVGYKAVRTHSGMTYKMEIHEGLKGPLFSIASTDGQSYSGQTPDIAWESFQKKGCPRVKLWHGKRFSCNIDGIEFFGFKNPFVQRLLRELVANVGGTAERSTLPFSSGNADLETKHRSQWKDTSPDMLPYIASPQIKGKRSRKGKTKNVNSTCEASHKKLRTKGQMHNNDTADSRQGTQSCLNGETSKTYPASNQEHGVCNNAGAFAASTNLETAVERENDNFLFKDGSRLESSHYSDHLEKVVPPQKESNHVSSEDSISTGIAGNVSIHDQPLDRSKNAEIQMLSSSIALEDKDGEAPVPKDNQNVNDLDLCAPDSLDLLHESTSDAQPNSPKESPCNGQSELIIENRVIFEGLAPELHPQEEISTLNASSEKSDYDSAGQEIANTSSNKSGFDSIGHDIANSMMTLLLPRALPLLKTFSRKKKTTRSSSEISPCLEQKQKKNNGTDHHADVASPGVHTESSLVDQQEKEKMHLLNGDPRSVVPSVELNALVVPESIEYGLSGSDVVEAGLAAMDESISRSDTLRLPVGADALDQSSICHVGTSDNKYVCSSNKGPVTSMGRPIKRDILISGTGNTPSTQIQNEASSTRKHDTPLTESIIFKSFNDGYAPDTHSAANFLLATDIHPASSSNHNPHRSLSSGVDAGLERRPYSLHMQKTNKSNGGLHNVAPVLLRKQEFLGHLNFGNNLDLLDPSAPFIEKSPAQVDKELQWHQNTAHVKNPVSRFQKLGSNLCASNMDVADGSSLKLQMNVGHNDKQDRIVELVGCYVHPLPVSLVLLSMNENEIYICVLCGVTPDKSRTLFLYNLSLKEQRVGCPSFIGHTPILLPTSKDAFGREIALEKSGLQFTPDGQCLVLANCAKAPYCREGKMQCLCSACRSGCLENNAVKVVQVKRGYISVVANLKTVDNVHCILVCEPNYLVSVEESGRLHLWVMNSKWSALMEECDLSTSDCIFPCIVELKKIPSWASLVVGHNGFGEFGLWDILKRTFVARFSSPSTSVFQFLPISLFRWQSKPHQGHINDIMAATKTLFSEQYENHVSIPVEGEDVAIWLFISTVCKTDVQDDFQSSDHKINPAGSWRLALLVKNRVILGSALDARAAAIGALAGHGVIGTGDGLVYMWELSSGTKLHNLQCFKGVGVSYIAVGDSRSGPMAVAGGDQLMVYLQSQGGLF